MGTSASKSAGSNAKAVSQIGFKLYEQSAPLRKEVLGQTLEAMQTGGVQAQIPSIQRSTEQARVGLASGLREFDERAAFYGQTGNPYSESARAVASIAGEQTVQGIGPQLARQDYISNAQSLALGYPGLAHQYLATGVGNQMALKQSNQALVGQGVGALGQMGAAACWVAEALWGMFDKRTIAARRWVTAHNNWFTRLYLRYGEQWSQAVERNFAVRALAWPVWRAMALAGGR